MVFPHSIIYRDIGGRRRFGRQIHQGTEYAVYGAFSHSPNAVKRTPPRAVVHLALWQSVLSGYPDRRTIHGSADTKPDISHNRGHIAH